MMAAAGSRSLDDEREKDELVAARAPLDTDFFPSPRRPPTFTQLNFYPLVSPGSTEASEIALAPNYLTVAMPSQLIDLIL